MDLRRTKLAVAGREFVVVEPTYGVMRAAAGDQRHLLRGCVAELADATDEQIDALPMRVAEALLNAVNAMVGPEPDFPGRAGSRSAWRNGSA